jgi:hypothetical protein
MAKDEQTPSKDWRLEEGDDVDERWVLQDSEQQLNEQWDIEGVDEPVSQWQPVEYEKQGRSRFLDPADNRDGGVVGRFRLQRHFIGAVN